MPRRTPRAPASPPAAPLAARAHDVVVEEVVTPGQRDEFVRFQLDHYRGDPRFIPPIVAERRDFIDPRVNPFFDDAEGAFFLARRRGRVVGRIAAVVDARYNRFHGTSDGTVGLFESQNDPGLAAALFENAVAWLAVRGMSRVVGPVNLAFHHDVGLLLEGYERPPAMMTPYNHRYYPWLFEANGFLPLQDLRTYELLTSQALPEKVVRLAERVKAQGRVRVRRLDTANPEGDIRRIKAIYETMLKPGFGFAPLTDAEFTSLVQLLRPVILLRPELSLIAEADGEAVAFGITLPDTSLAQRAARGYLFPFGLARMLWEARNIDRLRALLFGIKAGWRRRGIDALLALETFRQAQALGYTGGELGWVTEDDHLMNRTIQATGARQVKRFRVYQRAIEPRPSPAAPRR